MTESRKRKFDSITNDGSQTESAEPINKKIKHQQQQDNKLETSINNEFITQNDQVLIQSELPIKEGTPSNIITETQLDTNDHNLDDTQQNDTLILNKTEAIEQQKDPQTNVENEENKTIKELVKEETPSDKITETQLDDIQINKTEQKQENKVTDNTQIDPYTQYNWNNTNIILRATSTFMDHNNDHYKYLDGGNFLKSIYWSPNGFHLLSNSNDRKLRIFNPLNDIYYANNDEMKPSVIYEHREPIYDISWYPLFKTNDYSSNVFLSCSRDSPIYMFDSWQNKKRCSYRYTFGDCTVTAHSVCFDSFGEYIYAGYHKYIIQFAVNKTGNQFYRKIECVNKNKFGEKSIISCIKFIKNNNNVFCSGCYDGIAQLFDVRCNYAVCGFKCVSSNNNGITDISFSPCNNYLLCGSRRCNDINCWDLRKIKESYYVNRMFGNQLNYDKFNDGNTRVLKDNDHGLCAKYKRNIINNQRVQFDIDKYSGYWIVSGNQNGNYCAVYDVNCTDFDVEPKYRLEHDVNVESVSSAQLCPTHPFLATTIGQRVLSKPNTIKNHNEMKIDNESGSESESDSDTYIESNVNDICIWDLRYQ